MTKVLKNYFEADVVYNKNLFIIHQLRFFVLVNLDFLAFNYD